MKVFVKGKGEINLTQKDFLAAGGEGSVYTKGGVAYKIYNDAAKMIPLGKMQELSVLSDPHIIKPEEVLLDNRNAVVGYTMKYVSDTFALCQLFTKAFRERNNLSPTMMLDLVRKLQVLVEHVHNHKILIVDLNEMNFLASKKLDDIFAIDVDSYQTPNFPATAIMESIRDRHTKGFNLNTDWFSFGVITFQMFVGIHPYKGKHPVIKNWEDRMMQNISVLNKDVSIPSACYPFTVIPEVYRQWYQAIFDFGKRMPPPSDLQAAIHILHTVKKIVGSDNFDMQELDTFADNIVDVLFSGPNRIVLTTNGAMVNKNKADIPPHSLVVFTPKTNAPISATVESRQLKLLDVSKKKELPVTLTASDVMRYNNRLYVKSNSNVVEVEFKEMGLDIIPTFKVVGQILENATEFFPGAVVQNLLGSFYISLFPQSGSCCQIRTKELDGHKIIDAKFENGILMIVGSKGGKYHKFILRFDTTPNDNYDLRVINDITYSGLNFAVLDSGVCVHLTDDEDIEIFRNDKTSQSIKVIDDAAITNDMKLFKNGVKLLFAKDNKLFSFAMKNKP